MPQLKLKVKKAARRPLRLVAAIRPAVAVVAVVTTSRTRTSTQKGRFSVPLGQRTDPFV